MKCKLLEGCQLLLRTWPHHKLVCFVGFRKVGNLWLKDDDRSGIPAMTVNKDNISPVKKCLRKIHSQPTEKLSVI